MKMNMRTWLQQQLKANFPICIGVLFSQVSGVSGVIARGLSSCRYLTCHVPACISIPNTDINDFHGLCTVLVPLIASDSCVGTPTVTEHHAHVHLAVDKRGVG